MYILTYLINLITRKKDFIITKINPIDIVFKNNLITIAWNDTRLDLLDSDENFIDYFFDSLFYDKEEQEKKIEKIINNVEGLNEKELCNYLFDSLYSIFKIEPFCGDEETMKQLREEWGNEYVNRIGNTALIIKE